MPFTKSFVCPHCEKPIGGDELPDIAPVAAMGIAAGWGAYIVVCPHCSKPLGSYAAPKRQPRQR